MDFSPGLLSVLLYSATSVLIGVRLFRAYSVPLTAIRLLWFAGLGLHASSVLSILFINDSLDLGLFKAGSASAFLIAAVLFFSCLYKPLDIIALIILPLTALFAFLGLPDFSGISHHIVVAETLVIKLHIVSSLLAYSTLSVATALAILLHFQSIHLRQGNIHSPLNTLPALDAGESFLFNIIILSLFLLTNSLFTGWIIHEDLMAQHLVHKTVLSICAWILLLILVVGRILFGWRGNRLMKFTVAGAVLLLLAYFGSKTVLELIL